jgi:hypothetical protein
VAFAPPERRAALEQAAEEAGGRVLPFTFTAEGVAVWEREDA